MKYPFYSLLASIACSFLIAPVLAAQDYVGHDRCQNCHSEVYDHYINSGHPYKLNKVENGVPPEYPWSVLPDTPVGYTWNDVSYVIGGFGWKARFVDTDGYIITGEAVQYNLATEAWVGYHADEAPGTKPYDCGKCHTTGWQTFEENGGFRQDDLPGMAGTFAAPGVTCEACHGPGSDHVAGPSKNNILVDTSKELCGQCHTRDPDRRIAASGGFIKHHEQYDELVNSPHRFMDCGRCHEPHKSVIYELGGLLDKDNCTSCHSGIEIALPAKQGMSCTSCHMPLAAKSAVKTGVDGLLGDIHSHSFKLNTDYNQPMFTEDGKFVELDAEGDAVIKVEFACLDCHDGVTASERDDEFFYQTAASIHNSETWGGYAVNDGLVDTGDWMGWLYVGDAPWIFSYSLSGWIYTGEPIMVDPGSWVYFSK